MTATPKLWKFSSLWKWFESSSGILFSTLPDGNTRAEFIAAVNTLTRSKAVQPADHTISLLYEKEGRGLKLVLAMMKPSIQTDYAFIDSPKKAKKTAYICLSDVSQPCLTPKLDNKGYCKKQSCGFSSCWTHTWIWYYSRKGSNRNTLICNYGSSTIVMTILKI